MSLPQLTTDAPFIADGGLETRLIFQDGVDLPEFAAFPLLADEEGTATLDRYHQPYLDIAERCGTGIVLDTATWRASLDWGARLGADRVEVIRLNRRAVELAQRIGQQRPAVPTVVNGVVGPRGDGYEVGAAMLPTEAAAYHALQARAFADAGADMISAITMTYADEAIGISLAAATVGLPVVVAFTVETDGRLPSGQSIGDAVNLVDEATDGAPAYFMINCAHPTHFLPALGRGERWVERIRGVRANASTASHAELDEAEELDRGDIAGLAGLYGELSSILDLRVVGGCCGTDHDHVEAMADAVLAGAAI